MNENNGRNGQWPLIAAPPSTMSLDAHRRISNTYDPSDFIGSTRRVSLREMPSFRNDVSPSMAMT